jgi:hypothetical protein
VAKKPLPLEPLNSLRKILFQQPAQELYTDSIRKWKRDLAGRDKEVVKEIAGDMLIDLGM